MIAAEALGISFRPITDDDLPFLFAVYASTRAEELAVTGWPEEMKQQFLAQQFDAQHRHYQRHYPDAEWLVIERRGEPVGRLYVEEWESQMRIIDISLLPAARGGGAGSAILGDLMRDAAAKSKRVSIQVERTNPAMRLYHRLGFVTLEEQEVYHRLEWEPRESPV